MLAQSIRPLWLFVIESHSSLFFPEPVAMEAHFDGSEARFLDDYWVLNVAK